MSNIKDTITNILAFVLVIGDVIYQFLISMPTGEPFNIWQFVMVLATAIIAYFTGKTSSGKTKSPSQLT